MGKFPFKRPRIISKKFPEIDSSIDGVTKSLNDLVFSYREQVHNALSKKHWMMAFSSLAVLLVLGSFISPKGKAESSIFYPETCLGGWINPQHAQGEQETTSNGDESQFTNTNSAVLPKNTNAEMYCGNFKGKFDTATKPTKIMVSLALTKGKDLLPEDTLESGLVVSTSSLEMVDVASSSLLQASSSDDGVASSTYKVERNEETGTSTHATSSDTHVDTAIATPGAPKQEGPTVLDGVVKSIQDTLDDLFKRQDTTSTQTDTVVVPTPTPAEEPKKEETSPVDAPTSYRTLRESIFSYAVEKVFAQEDMMTLTTTSTEETPVVSSFSEQETVQGVIHKNEEENTKETVLGIATTSLVNMEVINSSSSSATRTRDATSISTSTTATSSDEVSSSEITASSTDDNQFQNNFLEVLYTFDGVTWTSLGDLNEISMKYRTFEIPVTASTSWNDLAHLQIKVQAKKHELDTPTVYLDGIKVEVLYESELEHMHPDFARDTILKDEIVDGIRIVTIINNDTKEQEVWYMYLEEGLVKGGIDDLAVSSSTATQASSTDIIASSTLASTTELTYEVDASSTNEMASSTHTPPVLDLLKTKWKKYTGKDTTLPTSALVEEIKKQEDAEKKEEIDVLPDFASDTIKMMKGVFSHTVLVQIERGTDQNPRDELWLYDMEKNTEERVDVHASSSLSVAVDSPLGVKGGYLFWLSLDKRTVYAYSLKEKTVLEESLPSFDVALGERAEVLFASVPWKVIVGHEGFSFYSVETGEVFSDEDSRTVEALRMKLGLDKFLDKETLGNFNLPVSADSVDGTNEASQ